MTMALDDYARMLERVEVIKLRSAKTEGRQEELLKQLKELGCSSLEAAEKEIENLIAKRTKIQQRYWEVKDKVEQALKQVEQP